MNKYVILEKQDGKLYGRVSFTAETKGGIVVFPHYKNEIELKEGFVRIDSISIKEKNNKKVGFISGVNVEPDKEIDIDSLSIKNLHDLLSYGAIKSLMRYNGYQCILIKEPTIMDVTTHLAFMVDGEFIFVKKLKYMNTRLDTVMDLRHIQKNIHKKGLSNRYIVSSASSPCMRYVSDDIKDIINDNSNSIIWRLISLNPNHPKHYILLYNCNRDSDFNQELYDSILKYNNNVNYMLRKSNVLESYDDKEVASLFKTLSNYGYGQI